MPSAHDVCQSARFFAILEGFHTAAGTLVGRTTEANDQPCHQQSALSVAIADTGRCAGRFEGTMSHASVLRCLGSAIVTVVP